MPAPSGAHSVGVSEVPVGWWAALEWKEGRQMEGCVCGEWQVGTSGPKEPPGPPDGEPAPRCDLEESEGSQLCVADSAGEEPAAPYNPPLLSIPCSSPPQPAFRKGTSWWKVFQAPAGSLVGGVRAPHMEIWEDRSSPLWGQSSPGLGPWVSLAQLGQPSELGLTPWLQVWGFSAGQATAAGREAPSGWSSPVGTWGWLGSADVGTWEASLSAEP